MKKLEEKMINAVNSGRNYKNSNTEVFAFADGSVFVKLYNTVIFAKVAGQTFYSDGGWNTVTTASRLRALGADYSINAKKNNCKLTDYKVIYDLFTDRLFTAAFGK